jgi:hypothetical protein
VKIPARHWQSATSTINVSDSYPVFALVVKLNVSGSLAGSGVGFSLRSPDGTSYTLYDLTYQVPLRAYHDARGTLTLTITGGASATLVRWSMEVVGGAVPQIVSLSASPSPVDQGNPLTLTAGGVTDYYPGGTVTRVAFYLDSDGDGRLDPSKDLFLGYGTKSGTSWSLTFSTSGWAVGTHTFFAVATDDFGVESGPVSVSVQIRLPGGNHRPLSRLTTPDEPAPGYTV